MKAYLTHSFVFTLALLLFNFSNVKAQVNFDRQDYFAAFASNNSNSIDEQLKKTAALGGTEKDAFEGALLMRKAGKQSAPGKKLSLFKQGAKKLEAAIKTNPKNIEYRFLRLMIQENAPKIVGYNSNLKTDSELVKSQAKSLPAATQNAINSYAATSKYL